MAASSVLFRLYEVAFDRPPSAMSEKALLRIEHVLGLAQDDHLARLFVVFLYVADQFLLLFDRRKKEEDDYLRRLDEHIGNLDRETRRLEQCVRGATSGMEGSDNAGGWPRLPTRIEHYDTVSPLLAWLGEAFHRAQGDEEARKRPGLARLDLMMAIGVAAVLVLVGMAIGRAGL